jgi:hypothetical protein
MARPRPIWSPWTHKTLKKWSERERSRELLKTRETNRVEKVKKNSKKKWKTLIQEKEEVIHCGPEVSER